MNTTPQKYHCTVDVLMAEDNADHAFLASEAFTDISANIALHTVADGEQCIASLQRQAPRQGAPRPDLVLLDVNLLRMTGDGALRHINADPSLRSLPVVMLSTAAEPSDVNLMHKLGCNAYLVKPGDFGALPTTLTTLGDFSFDRALLPTL